MTCIVGFIDKKNGITYIGADSLGSNGYTGTHYLNKKLFKEAETKDIIYGLTSSFRAIDIMKHNNLFDEKDIKLYNADLLKLDAKYLVNTFIPKLQGVLKDKKYFEYAGNDKKYGPTFLIAVGTRLYEVQRDFSLLEPADGYSAVGSGEDHAIASFHSTEGEDPKVRVRKALEAAAKSVISVAGPFYMLNTKTNEVEELKNEHK